MTVVGLQLGMLISGAVVTEQIFVIPGFGKLTLDAVLQRDFPLDAGGRALVTFGYVLINLLVDLLYSVLNPRIRVAGRDMSTPSSPSPAPPLRGSPAPHAHPAALPAPADGGRRAGAGGAVRR